MFKNKTLNTYFVVAFETFVVIPTGAKDQHKPGEIYWHGLLTEDDTVPWIESLL